MSARGEMVVSDGSSEDGDGVAVVVPVYNARSYLPGLLDHLLDEHRRFPFSLCLADNGSTDGSWELVQEFARSAPFTRAIRSVEHQCAAHARNVGAQHATEDLLLFCDADDLPGDGWVETMVSGLRGHPFVNGALEYARLNSPAQRASRTAMLQDRPTFVFGCAFASGANFGCRRWVWEALGGQDTSVPPGAEDLDFSLRSCRQLGVEAQFLPEAVVHYRLRSGLADTYAQARNYGQNEVAIYRRHGDVPARARFNGAIVRVLRLVSAVPQALYSASGRSRFVWRLGKAVGRVKGSLRHRVFYP